MHFIWIETLLTLFLSGCFHSGIVLQQQKFTQQEQIPSHSMSATAPYQVSGYFPEWAIYERNFHVFNIPAKKLTHLIYAFLKIDQSQVAISDPYAALQKSYPQDSKNQTLKGNFNQLRLLKSKFPHLNILVSIGGFNHSNAFSSVSSTQEARKRFSISLVDFLKKYPFFNGIDIDWEYPASLEEGQQFLALL